MNEKQENSNDTLKGNNDNYNFDLKEIEVFKLIK